MSLTITFRVGEEEVTVTTKECKVYLTCIGKFKRYTLSPPQNWHAAMDYCFISVRIEEHRCTEWDEIATRIKTIKL